MIRKGRSWLPWLVTGMAALLCIGLYWRDAVSKAALSAMHNNELDAASALVGTSLRGHSIKVRSPTDVSFTDLWTVVPSNSIVVVWSRSCEACQALLRDVQTSRYMNEGGRAPSLFFLVRSEAELPEADVSPVKLLISESWPETLPFGGRIVPAIWYIDRDGRLGEYIIGYSPTLYARLAQKAGAEVSEGSPEDE